MRHVSFLILAVILATPFSALARIWYVRPDSTGDVPSIKAGLDSASYGDTVLVAPGVYLRTGDPETNIIPGPGVCLTSDEGPELTIIEVCGAGGGISLGECEGARVSGFTVRYGDEPGCVPGMGWPTGIFLGDCLDVIVEDCIVQAPAYGIQVHGAITGPDMPIIRGNRISNCAYGLDCGGSFARLTPLFQDNVVTDCNFGIHVDRSAPRIDGNSITNCRWMGMQFGGDCGGNCTRNIIANNGYIGGDVDHGGVWIGGDTEGQTVSFNKFCEPAMANDFYGNTGCDICTRALGEYMWVDAEYNYWGSDCPDFSGRFLGKIWCGIWVDSAHTSIFTDWSHCQKPTEPSTWGGIKAIYR